MSILRLLPQPGETTGLKGLYLAHDLRRRAAARPDGARPFLYSNFITSLDGRIAVERDGELGVPRQTANARDWRLFQELAAQADALLVTGPFMAKLAAGSAEPIAQFDKAAFADLATWRRARNLPPRPDLVVLSRSLTFDLSAPALADGRKVRVATIQNAPPSRKRALVAQGAALVTAGETAVTGRALVRALAGWGYGVVYSPAGPDILHLLAAADVLDRLYLTIAPRILGGDPFLTLARGPLLDPAASFTLDTLYHDPTALDGAGQLYAAYDRQHP